MDQKLKRSLNSEIPGDEHQAYSETYLLLSMSAIEIFETPIKGYPKKGYLSPNITKSTDLFVHLLIFTCGFQHVQIPVFHHTGPGDT